MRQFGTTPNDIIAQDPHPVGEMEAWRGSSGTPVGPGGPSL